jgi:hypothetical protein
MRRLLPLLCYFIASFVSSYAQGDLLVAPTRVVFEANKLRESITLVNTGKDTATYFISYINYNMTEDGGFRKIDKPDSVRMSAEPFLRVFPRKVTLIPGEPQLIMLQFKPRSDMSAGEYRSHLVFRAAKNFDWNAQKNSSADTVHLSVQLIARYGISIPVIIRSGQVHCSVFLNDLSFSPGILTANTLKFTISRTGNISVYGDIDAEFIPSHGKPFKVGFVRGIAVYTNINRREMSLNLNIPAGKSLSDGMLRLKYMNSGNSRPVTYASADILVK